MVCHIVRKVLSKGGEGVSVIECVSRGEQHSQFVNLKFLLVPFLPQSTKPVLQFLRVNLVIVAAFHDLPYSLNVDGIAYI